MSHCHVPTVAQSGQTKPGYFAIFLSTIRAWQRRVSEGMLMPPSVTH